ncbi:MAG: VCBS repeat-containing protein [Planctomycetaceae bacterium]
MRCLSYQCCLLLSLIALPLSAKEFKQLEYNHPGLVVDLGVGLWAWPVPCDADGDGDYDLIVSCPDKPSNGVWLFENTSGDTAVQKFPVFKPGRHLGATTRYVMPSYQEGKMRVISPGFEYTNFETAGISEASEIPLNMDFYKPVGSRSKGNGIRHNQWRYVDFDGDGQLDISIAVEDWSEYGWDDAWNAQGEWTNGPLHGFVFIARNTGTNEKPVYATPEKVQAGNGPLDVYGCPSPNFEDFDGDGDLDLICGEFLDGFTWFENTGSRSQPRYAPGQRMHLDNGTPLTMDLEMIVPVAIDWDRDGDFDLVVGDEDGRVALIENTGRMSDNQGPVFLPPRYFQQEAATLKCGALATPVGIDWDSDGDMDIVSGNTAGYLEYFENLSGGGVEYPRWAAPVRLTADGKIFRIEAGKNGSIQGPAEAKWGYTTLSVADWDQDGLLDILVNGIKGEVSWLRNTGTRSQPVLTAAAPIEVAWTGGVPQPAWNWSPPDGRQLISEWRTTPMATDWDGDGLIDLVMLDHEGYLALFRRARREGQLVLLPGERVFLGTNLSVTSGKHVVVNAEPGRLQLNNGTAGGSGRRKLCLTDWDGDGRMDILANSISANFLRQTGSDGMTWSFKDEGVLIEQSIQGHSTSPTTVDFNGDGVPDLLCGAEDGRFYYLRSPRSQ